MQYRISGLGLLSLAASTAMAMPHNHANQHAQLHERQLKRDVNAAPYAMGNSSALYAPTGAVPAGASTLHLTQTMDVTQYYTQTNVNPHHASAMSAAAAASASPASVAAAEASGEVCSETEVTVTVTPQAVTVTVTASSEESSSSAAAVSTPAYVAPSSATPVYVAPSSAAASSAAEAVASSPAYVAPSSVAASSAAAVTSSVEETSSAAYVAPLTSAVAEASSYIASVVASSTVASSTVESSAAASSTSSSSTDTVAKKGLVYNDYSVISEFTSSGTIGWIWNWAQSPGGTVPSGIEYVPSLQNTEGMTNWKTTAKEQIENGSKHLMSFNEPDRTSADGGADLDASTAASYYKEYMNPFSSDDVKLVSPSVCNGDEASVGLNWLEEFMDACDGGCTVDYINIHWYATWTDFSGNMDAAIEYFKSYCDSAYQKFQKPLWITEIGLYSADDSTQQELLDAILPWMAKDNQSYIERYSYFKADTIATSDLLMTAYTASD